MERSAPQGGAGSDDPHSGSVSVGRDRPRGHSGRSVVRTSSSVRDLNEDFPTEVEASFAPNAAVCGALGCRETAVLLSVKAGGKKRVLCSDCVVDFVEREGSDG